MSDTTGRASSLSKFQIAGFFVVGFFLLPLSPMWFVVSAFYQLCLVQGTLSSYTRVITAIVLCFFAVAWIPYVNLIFYFREPEHVRQQIPVLINGAAPMGLLVIFYIWGSVIGYRYYTIPSSYEQSKDRESVLRLKKTELNPPLRIARSVAIAARGHQHMDDPSEMMNAGADRSQAVVAAALVMGADSLQYAYGTYDVAPPATTRALESAESPSSGGGGGAAEDGSPGANTSTAPAAVSSPLAMNLRNRGHTFAVFSQSPRDSIASPRDSDNMMASPVVTLMQLSQQQHAAATAAAAASGSVPAAAAATDERSADVVIIKNAYELHSLLQQETGEGVNRTMLFGIVVAGALIGAGRGIEHANPPSNAPDAFKSPLYELATVFAVFFFTQLFSTLYFVRLLYQQATHLVYVLTFLGRGTTDLRSDRLLVAADDSDEEEVSNSQSAMESVTGHGGANMRLVSAATFAADTDSQVGFDDEDLLNPQGAAATAGAGAGAGSNGNAPANSTSYGSASSADNNNNNNNNSMNNNPFARAFAEAQTISSTAAKSAIVEMLDPFNPSHLNGWNEVRKLAADYIASDYSILNSFLQPTLVLAGPLAVFGLSLYLAVRILFIPSGTKGNVLGIFTIVALALDGIFLIYLVLIYQAAREARRHFKSHETIVARIAFDVARDLEHAVRKRSQGTLDETNKINNNNNNSNVSNSNNLPLLQQQQQQQPQQQQQQQQHYANGAASAAATGGNVAGAGSVYSVVRNGKLLSGIAHEPPRDPIVLQRLFDSVNSLCNHLQTNSPRPLFLGVRTSSSKWILCFSFAVTALMLFFGLLRAQRQGKCNVIVPNATMTTTATTAMGSHSTTALPSSSAATTAPIKVLEYLLQLH